MAEYLGHRYMFARSLKFANSPTNAARKLHSQRFPIPVVNAWNPVYQQEMVICPRFCPLKHRAAKAHVIP